MKLLAKCKGHKIVYIIRNIVKLIAKSEIFNFQQNFLNDQNVKISEIK